MLRDQHPESARSPEAHREAPAKPPVTEVDESRNAGCASGGRRARSQGPLSARPTRATRPALRVNATLALSNAGGGPQRCGGSGATATGARRMVGIRLLGNEEIVPYEQPDEEEVCRN